MNTNRPTMAEVALRAGVSRTLVSFVLSGKPGAGDETRRRVLAVAEEIGYRPDSVAQRLARGRSTTIGVLLDLRQSLHADIAEALYPAAENVGYDVLLSANLPDRAESAAVEALLSHRCGGLILLGSTSDQTWLQSLTERVPIVSVGRRLARNDAAAAGDRIGSIRTADATGIRQAVDYLVGLGHHEICHVDGGGGPGSAERRSAYRAAMRKHHLDDNIRIIRGAHTEGAGIAAARELLTGSTLPTAILASNDRCALGVLDVFAREGIGVPSEVSVIGFDDSRLSDYPLIDLTTVHQDAVGLAQHAVHLAAAMMEGDSEAPDMVLEPELIIRGSTAAPRVTRADPAAG